MDLLKVFIMKKTKTYMDKLMEDKNFRENFDKEYHNICIGEQIAGARHKAKLTQSGLAKQRKPKKYLKYQQVY